MISESNHNGFEPAKIVNFRDQLQDFMKKYYPGIDEKSQDCATSPVANRESIFKDRTISELLKEYRLNENITIKENQGLLHIPVTEHFADERLPESYAYEGGAARALLERTLGMMPVSQPRDVDVVRIAPEEPYAGSDSEVFKKFSPEDAGNGGWMDIERNIFSYFQTRDLTINEVLATEQEIICTRQCLLDTVRHILRPTEHEFKVFEDSLGPKVLSKILRFYSEMIAKYGHADVQGMKGYAWEEAFISPFYLANQLDKAYQKGKEDAENFFNELKKRGYIPENTKSVEEAAEFLVGVMTNQNFYYRYAPKNQYEIEDGLLLDDYEKQPKLSGMGKKMK